MYIQVEDTFGSLFSPSMLVYSPKIEFSSPGLHCKFSYPGSHHIAPKSEFFTLKQQHKHLNYYDIRYFGYFRIHSYIQVTSFAQIWKLTILLGFGILFLNYFQFTAVQLDMFSSWINIFQVIFLIFKIYIIFNCICVSVCK